MAVGDKLEFLGEVKGDGSSTTVALTGIPTDSCSFIVTGIVSMGSYTYSGDLRVRFNNDSNSRYDYCQYLSSWGSNPAAGQYSAQNAIVIVQAPGTGITDGRSWFWAEFWNLSKITTSPGAPSMMCEVGGKNNGSSDTPYSGMTGAGSYSYYGGAPTGTDVTNLTFDFGAGGVFPTTSVIRMYKRPTS